MNEIVIVIRDGKAKGYWCGRRRLDGKVYDLVSSKKRDAARFHFHEAAMKIASTLPQQVTLEAA